MQDKTIKEVCELIGDGEAEPTEPLTDRQRINGTFWDNMTEAGIGWDDRIKVLESLRDALNTHNGTLYIP